MMVANIESSADWNRNGRRAHNLNLREIQNEIFHTMGDERGDSSRSIRSKQRTRDRQAQRSYKHQIRVGA